MTSEAMVRLAPRVPTTFEFTDEQRQIIRNSFLNGASDQEAAVLMEVAKARRLNPLTRQIHFIKRWDSQKRAEVWSAQVAIDGLRAIAERTGLYDGQDEPEFLEEKGSIIHCRVRVYRKDWSRPAVGVAYWSEYAQTNKEGHLTPMWARGKHFMLAKCAEALALRKAFPEDTSGLYTPEELGSEVDALPAPQPVAQPATEAKPDSPGRSRRANQVAQHMKPPPAAAAVIDVRPGETEEAAAQRQLPSGVFGGMDDSQLSAALDDARKRLEGMAVGSKTHGSMQERLKQLEEELDRRIPPGKQGELGA